MAKRYTVANLRLTIFVLWIVFATILSLIPCGLLFDKKMAEAGDIFNFIKMLAGLWIPALSCFSAFWFSEGNERGAKVFSPTQGQKVGSFALTFLYFGICILAVSLILFVQSYDKNPGDFAPSGLTMDQKLAEVISWLQLLSPVLLAPLALLTGRVPATNPANP